MLWYIDNVVQGPWVGLELLKQKFLKRLELCWPIDTQVRFTHTAPHLRIPPSAALSSQTGQAFSLGSSRPSPQTRTVSSATIHPQATLVCRLNSLHLRNLCKYVHALNKFWYWYGFWIFRKCFCKLDFVAQLVCHANDWWPPVHLKEQFLLCTRTDFAVR